LYVDGVIQEIEDLVQEANEAAEAAAESAAEAEGKVLQFKEQELGYFTHLIGDGDSLVSFLEAGGSVEVGYVARVNAVDDSAEVIPSTWKCTATDAELPGGATPGELYEGKLYVDNGSGGYYVFEYVGEGSVDVDTGEVSTLREQLASDDDGIKIVNLYAAALIENKSNINPRTLSLPFADGETPTPEGNKRALLDAVVQASTGVIHRRYLIGDGFSLASSFPDEIAPGEVVRVQQYSPTSRACAADWELISDSASLPSGATAGSVTGAAKGELYLLRTGSSYYRFRIAGQCNPLMLGAIGDDSTDDYAALQATLDGYNDIYIPAGNFRTSAGLVKRGNFYKIDGAGPYQAAIRPDGGSFDVLTLTNDGAAINRAFIKNFAIRSRGDRSGGATFNFDGVLTNCEVDNIYVRLYYDAFRLTGVAKSYFTNIWYDQFGRTVGTRGRYGWNMRATYGRMVDMHMSNIQGSGLVADSDPLSQIDAHFYVDGMDGWYMSDSHFFYADRGIIFAPTNTGNATIMASFRATAVYFDSHRLNHVRFQGSAAQYKDFEFIGCTFRDAEEDDSIVFDTASNVHDVRLTGGTVRDNFGTGLRAANSDFNINGLKVTGTTFSNNNQENEAVGGDIVYRGWNGTITGTTHKGGGTAGRGIYLLLNSENNTVTGANMSDSTASQKITDSGTGNKISAITGVTLKNKGTATINNGSTSVTVTHGLAMTPAIGDISVNLTNDATGVTRYYLANVTATTFDIVVDATPSSSADFAWKASVEG